MQVRALFARAYRARPRHVNNNRYRHLATMHGTNMENGSELHFHYIIFLI